MPTHLAAELATQPQCWATVAERAASWLPLLPQPGERVAAVGCGTSWFMAQAYAALRESRGLGVTDAVTASEFRWGRDYDRVVLLTRSGTTTEVVEVQERLARRGTPHVAIVATPGTPVATAADECILLTFADEQSVVQTRFATSALALLRLSLGDDLGAAIAQAQGVLAASENDLPAPLLDAAEVTFLGTGWSVGLAHEAALKLREAAQFWTESYVAMEYRHGPLAIAAPGRAVWALGTLPPGLADQIEATGAHLEHRPEVDPMAELVRVHRYALARATAAGLDADAPRHLTRSIILE